MKPKAERPETLVEAAEFTRRNNRYRSEGLCHRCAAQAAYGHAHGFNQVHPPCPPCQSVVESFPVVKVNGWRSLGRDARKGSARGT